MVVGDLLRSKKFVGMLSGAILTCLVWAAARFGLDLPEDQAQEAANTLATYVTGLVATYLTGQGLADMGKEKEKERAKGQAGSLLILVLIPLLVFPLVGCGASQTVRDKAATERAVHRGYLKALPKATRAELHKMVRLSAKAWAAMDIYLNGGPEPALEDGFTASELAELTQTASE